MSLAGTNRAAILCAVFSLVAMLVAANSSNGEPRVSPWPGVRGPNWDGRSLEREIAERWPASGPPVLWTRELGEGYSSFAAWDDRVATMYQTASTQYVVCLDATTGRTIWETGCGWAYERGGRYPGPRATPTFSAGRLYYATPLGMVGCLDARSGRRLWAVHLHDDLGARLPGFGYSCSPTVVDERSTTRISAVGILAAVIAPALSSLIVQRPWFTWPLAVCLSCDLLIAGPLAGWAAARSDAAVSSGMNFGMSRTARWFARLRLAGVLAIAGAWVGFCLQFGFIFEAAFAAGVVGSVPVALFYALWIRPKRNGRSGRPAARDCVVEFARLSAVSVAFYACGAALLLWRASH